MVSIGPVLNEQKCVKIENLLIAKYLKKNLKILKNFLNYSNISQEFAKLLEKF